MAVDEIVQAFEKEFGAIIDKFVILKLLNGKRNLDINELRKLDILEDGKKNMIWHPGAYLFFTSEKIGLASFMHSFFP